MGFYFLSFSETAYFFHSHFAKVVQLQHDGGAEADDGGDPSGGAADADGHPAGSLQPATLPH